MALAPLRDNAKDEPVGAMAGATAAARAPLTIAGVDPERGFSGGQTQVLGLTLAVLRAGHRAELFCDPAGALWRRARAAGVTCRALKIRNSIDVAAGLRLRAMLSAERYDVVHFHTARAHALAPFVRGRGCVSVVTRRMDYVPNRLFAPWLYNRATDAVAAISAGVAQALAQGGVDRRRITIIPSGVDCAWFAPPDDAARARARSSLGLHEDEVAVGALGALTPRKGQRFLLEAIALARRTGAGGPLMRCFIAGAGPLHDTLAAQVRELGLAGCVRIMGALDDPRALLWALDIFAMPSINEGLGVAALEAMACGLPVVASAVGGLRELVEHQQTGLLVPLGDAGALAVALERLAASRDPRLAMGVAARKAAVARYGMETMAQRTLELYYACLARVRA
jgi:glycosyltransferase involved in cell wall biosynthesis